jgi:Flp pilus assembly protein TadG
MAAPRLFADRAGATAVEFAFVALPFFMLLIGVIQLGMLIITFTTLDSATAAASRLILTGQMQQSGTASASALETAVCDDMGWLSSSRCAAGVLVDVRTFSSFSSISASPPVSNGALDPSQTQFDPGSPCSIVLVRVYYPYTLVAPLLEPGLPNLGSSQVLVTASQVFRNENYGGAQPCS